MTASALESKVGSLTMLRTVPGDLVVSVCGCGLPVMVPIEHWGSVYGCCPDHHHESREHEDRERAKAARKAQEAVDEAQRSEEDHRRTVEYTWTHFERLSESELDLLRRICQRWRPKRKDEDDWEWEGDTFSVKDLALWLRAKTASAEPSPSNEEIDRAWSRLEPLILANLIQTYREHTVWTIAHGLADYITHCSIDGRYTVRPSARRELREMDKAAMAAAEPQVESPEPSAPEALDSVEQFVLASTDRKDDYHESVILLRQAYTRWAEASSVDALSLDDWTMRLDALGYQQRESKYGLRRYGLRLKKETQ